MTHQRSFDIIAGAAASPVVLHVPHGSRWIPDRVRRRIVLSDAELNAELDRMTDSGTLEAAAAAGPIAWRFVNRCSRLVVDPERFPDEREEMEAVGMGAVYLRTSHGAVLRPDDAEHQAALLEWYFRPYAEALADVVDERIDAAGRAVIIDVHSYPRAALPYELHPAAARPQVCLGTDAVHTPDWLLAAARQAFAGFEVTCDEPFVGTYVPLRHYGRDRRVASLMVECRRDVLADPAGAARVAAAMRDLVIRADQRGG